MAGHSANTARGKGAVEQRHHRALDGVGDDYVGRVS
jgi:hypothetical protein